MPVTVAAAAVVLKAGHWRLSADRYRIELTSQPRHHCPQCRGAGGWWVGGANPEMEACGCWAYRPQLRLRLLPRPKAADEPPF
ncbi:hypothetical protein [Streptomyces melanogenes]|uniref:hypothetical protein n=1 Tax=Streptomyces melanogenes TaxID=67326 RepID=UPI001986D7B9|nr:hypothetical protein [Streptomyces melanogenes]GGP90182.1 hypothetical protein GCM10010278_80790 [Streptomyces melanogenes]